MPDFDLRPHGLDLQGGDGQLYHSEGVTPDEFENCTFEAARETLRAYGYQNLPDDEQMRQMVDPGSHGGEPWTASYNVVRKLAPDLPVVVEFPADVAAASRAYGEQGYVVHIGFWCDAQANVPAVGAVVGSHAEVLLYERGPITGWKNVWPHPGYELSDDQVRALYDGGGILIFKRPLPGAEDMTSDEHDKLWGIQADVDSNGQAILKLPDEISAKLAPFLTSLQGAVDKLAASVNDLAAKVPEKIVVNPAPAAVASTSPDPSWGALLAELLRRVLGKA